MINRDDALNNDFDFYDVLTLIDKIAELESKSIKAWVDNQSGRYYPEGVDSVWEKSAYEAAKRSAISFYKGEKQ